MITIVHGDDIVMSRNYLQEQKRKLTKLESLDGQFELEKFIQISQGSNLFFNEKNIFIENFFSKNKLNSNLTKNILDYINKNSSSFNLILWEGKELQKKYLNLFNKPSIKGFMIPKTIFSFLESVTPGNYKISIRLFHTALQNTEPELVFFMIQRQFRMLLAAADEKSEEKIDEVTRLATWQKGKLIKQAKLFSIDKLIELYDNLYRIELKQKTGGLPFSLDKAIDFFLLSI